MDFLTNLNTNLNAEHIRNILSHLGEHKLPTRKAEMAQQPLRLNVCDGWYHVWGRGLNRGSIFQDEADRKRFLEILGASTERFRLLVHAYVLMNNHFLRSGQRCAEALRESAVSSGRALRREKAKINRRFES